MAAPIEAGLTTLTEAKTLTVWDFGQLNEILWVKHDKELEAEHNAGTSSPGTTVYYNDNV